MHDLRPWPDGPTSLPLLESGPENRSPAQSGDSSPNPTVAVMVSALGVLAHRPEVGIIGHVLTPFGRIRVRIRPKVIDIGGSRRALPRLYAQLTVDGERERSLDPIAAEIGQHVDRRSPSRPELAGLAELRPSCGAPIEEEDPQRDAPERVQGGINLLRRVRRDAVREEEAIVVADALGRQHVHGRPGPPVPQPFPLRDSQRRPEEQEAGGVCAWRSCSARRDRAEPATAPNRGEPVGETRFQTWRWADTTTLST